MHCQAILSLLLVCLSSSSSHISFIHIIDLRIGSANGRCIFWDGVMAFFFCGPAAIVMRHALLYIYMLNVSYLVVINERLILGSIPRKIHPKLRIKCD